MPVITHCWSRCVAIQVLNGTSNDFLTFHGSVAADLARIESRPVGKALLRAINRSHPSVRHVTHFTDRNPETSEVVFDQGVKVVIIPKPMNYIQSGYRLGFGPGSTVRDVLEPSFNPAHSPPGRRFYRADGCNTEAADVNASGDGSGSVAIVRYSNAHMDVVGGVVTPSFIVLAHELIHALHFLEGVRDPVDEENLTRGIGVHSRLAITERAIRDEWGLPARLSLQSDAH